MANYYRVFCLEKDTLPEKVQLKKRYPGFAIVEADEEDIEEVSSRWGDHVCEEYQHT